MRLTKTFEPAPYAQSFSQVVQLDGRSSPESADEGKSAPPFNSNTGFQPVTKIDQTGKMPILLFESELSTASRTAHKLERYGPFSRRLCGK